MKGTFQIEVLENVTAPLVICPDCIIGGAYHNTPGGGPYVVFGDGGCPQSYVQSYQS